MLKKVDTNKLPAYSKNILQIFFALFFIALAIYFLRKEQRELAQVREVLESASVFYVFAGLIILVLYIIFQGQMYVYSFRTIHNEVSLKSCVILFLKRNLVSVFLPAGGITSLAFFTKEIEAQKVSKTQIHFASFVYGFSGFFSVFLLGVPTLGYVFVKYGLNSDIVLTFVLLGLFILGLSAAAVSLYRKGWLFRKLIKTFPSLELFLSEISGQKFNVRNLYYTILASCAIEVIGIVHLLISFKALGLEASLEASIIGYIVMVLFLLFSPLLRGMGAIEIALTYVLTLLGYETVSALSVTFLFRFFEFWLPLLVGILSFIFTQNNLLLRVFPALLIFGLGVVNILSGLTPAVPSRLKLLKGFLPLDTINVSNFLVIVIGGLLLIIAAFLLKGLRNAWMIALALSVLSLIGNLTKAIDYEESTIALFAIITLWITRKNYFAKSDERLREVGIKTAFLSIPFVLIYGIIGFYFLDKRHFNIDFSFFESAVSTIQAFFLLNLDNLTPHTNYARAFLVSINIMGVASIGFILYTAIRPYAFHLTQEKEDTERAREIISRYSTTSLDYFKSYSDKLFFFPTIPDTVVSYKYAKGYAMVLENPIAPDEEKLEKAIVEFDKYCIENGIKSVYYRVPESSINVYKKLNKKSLLIGQEAIVNLDSFTLEGGDKKALRNILRKVQSQGLRVKINTPPIRDGLMQKIKNVSDEWLQQNNRSELGFSQGIFDPEELKKQTILTVESSGEKVFAFVNMLPYYSSNETTFDLMRKTQDAPNGTIDLLMVEMFKYLRARKYQYVNLGLVPMTGINKAKDFPEATMKFAYEKIKRFTRYRGLRNFKEKFAPEWINNYLVYDHHYDLIQVPFALNAVFKI